MAADTPNTPRSDMRHLWENKTPANVPVVAVKWRDIRSASHWSETDQREEVRVARDLTTVGFLLYRGVDTLDPKLRVVVIAGSYDGEEKAWADITAFPRDVIKQILDLGKL